MTTLDLNTQIYRYLADISTDETLLKKVADYMKKLLAQKPDHTLMTKEEFFQHIDKAKEGPLYELNEGETIEDLIKRVA